MFFPPYFKHILKNWLLCFEYMKIYQPVRLLKIIAYHRFLIWYV